MRRRPAAALASTRIGTRAVDRGASSGRRSTGTARGARRAPRAAGVEIQLDGNPASVVDLSTVGAQVLSPTILRPNQKVRVSIPNDEFVMRFRGAIAWAKFELPKPTDAAALPRRRRVHRRRRHGASTTSARANKALVATSANQRARASSPSRMIVSSRAEPVDTIAAGTPVISSSRAM